MTVDPAVMRGVWQHLRARDTRPRPAAQADRPKLKITNLVEEGETAIYLYDEIGFWGVTAGDFMAELLAINSPAITLHINSPGGDVFDGVAIYNGLRNHPAAVTVKVDALAASAASFIAMAGDTVHMQRGSQMMIHDASGIVIGNAADMREMMTLLDRISDTIADLYATRAGGEPAGWRELMRAETWYSAAEAVAAGLADATDDAAAEQPEEPAAAARFDLALTSFHYAGRGQAPAPPSTPRLAARLEPTPVTTGSVPGSGQQLVPSRVDPTPPDPYAQLSAVFAAMTPTTKEAAL